ARSSVMSYLSKDSSLPLSQDAKREPSIHPRVFGGRGTLISKRWRPNAIDLDGKGVDSALGISPARPGDPLRGDDRMGAPLRRVGAPRGGSAPGAADRRDDLLRPPSLR